MDSVSALVSSRTHGLGGLVGFYSGSGQDQEQYNLLLLPGIKPKVLGCQAGSQVAILTVVYRLS
jgi:hypothetical protein